MLDRVQKTKLCHAFSFPLSAIRHTPSSSAWPRGAVPSVSQPSGMRWHANSKKRSPHKPLRLLNKKGFSAFLLPNLEWLWKYRLGTVSCWKHQVALSWWPSGSIVECHHHYESQTGKAGLPPKQSMQKKVSRNKCQGLLNPPHYVQE